MSENILSVKNLKTYFFTASGVSKAVDGVSFDIAKGEPEYYEAKRLLKFLEYFLGVSSENLPNKSIVREFVGGSCFNV